MKFFPSFYKLFSICAVINLNLQFCFGQTNISGIVNTYVEATSVTCNTISVASTAGFFPNDRVLIIQMQGAIIDTTQTANFGNITNMANCGNYEFANIAIVNGNNISLKRSLKKQYDAAGKVQIIKVPHYTSANVTGLVTSPPWNGATGGVVVFEVDNTLSLASNIDVSGAGFRGGSATNNPDNNCGTGSNLYAYDVNQGGAIWNEGGAQKGEGIAILPNTQNAGRGKAGTGGGGGNKHNAGGGGGSNYTEGGTGGNDNCANAVGGSGGASVATNFFQNKIFFGGGGGCGDANDGAGTPGTNGGGIIIIKAADISGNGFAIKANGADQLTSAAGPGDGGGGGGGAGTILLDVPTYTSIVVVEAKGGKGGDVNPSTAACFGPGGGGGSGLIWIVPGFVPPNLSPNTSAGLPGNDLAAISPCFNTTNNATAGTNNAQNNFLNNLSLQESFVNYAGIINLGNDTTLCNGDTIILNGGLNANLFLWQDGSTNMTYTVTTPGIYILNVVDGNYCAASDTIDIATPNSFIYDLGNDTTLCNGQSLVFDLTSLAANYQWSNGSTNPIFTISTAGSYTVTVTQNGYCTLIDSIKVIFINGFNVDIGNDTTLCKNETLTLDAGNPGLTYNWSTGEATQQITITAPGNYFVEVTDASCLIIDSININYRFLNIELGTDTFVCNGSSIPFAFDTTYKYKWSDGSTKSTFNITTAGTYWVVAKDSTCAETDTIQIEEYSSTEVFVPNAFTPNDDATNELYKPATDYLEKYLFRIFDRYGHMVFETADPLAGWDGTFLDQPAPEGMYAYTLTYYSPCSQYKIKTCEKFRLMR